MLRSLSRWLPAPAARSPRPRWRPVLTPLEDRCTPASFAGNTITLDDPGETLTIAAVGVGLYFLTSTTDVNGNPGSVSFTPGAGPVTVVDTAANTSLRFGNHAVDFIHSFEVTLSNATLVGFGNNTSFGENSLSVTTTRRIVVGPDASVTTTSGNITFSANQQAVATTDFSNAVVLRNSARVTSVSGTVSVSGRGGLGGTRSACVSLPTA